MAIILLKNNHGFLWYSSETISIKGSFFDKKNNYYEGEKMLSFFDLTENLNDFLKKIKEINGIFTVLLKLENKIFIACDITRIFSLFYSHKNGELFISDNIDYLKEKINISEIDQQASEEFLASGFTIGKKTLLRNIYQLQSSEYIFFDNNSIIDQGFYFSYATKNTNSKPFELLKEQAINSFENSFKRLIKSLNNRQVVIPLSGGYDSRLIAVMLKKYNYNNVVCFTYGKKDNIEIENSKKTAKALNYKWIFIEHTKGLIKNYINSSIFKEYASYTGKYSSMPYLQEYVAVKYLSENKLIIDDAIFIPGHSGDFLGGSQFKKVIPSNLSFKKISEIILKKKYYYNKTLKPSKLKIAKNINDQIRLFDTYCFSKIPHTVFEDYDLKERITKIIFNSSNIFTFFKYEHRFPFWDKELLTFFKKIPLEHKKMKYLYDDILTNYYFEMFNVNFKKEIQPTNHDILIQKIKESFKPFIPYFIKKYFLQKNDWLNSLELTNEMKESLQKNKIIYNKNIEAFNELNILWYYYYSIGKIKK